MNVKAKLRVSSVGNIGRQLLLPISEQAKRSFGFAIGWALLSTVFILAGGLWAFNSKLYARLYSRVAIGDYVARDPGMGTTNTPTFLAHMRVQILLCRHRRNLPPAQDAQTTLGAVAYHFAVLAGGEPAAATTYRKLPIAASVVTSQGEPPNHARSDREPHDVRRAGAAIAGRFGSPSLPV